MKKISVPFNGCLVSLEDNTVVISSLELAADFKSRFFGLMGRESLSYGEGLLLPDVSAIHMMFMRFAIDVVFLDRDSKVLQVDDNVSPWTGFAARYGAWAVLEISAGYANKCGIKKGMRLLWSESNGSEKDV